MGGLGSGGHNRKSVAEHLRFNTYRRDRHGPKVVTLPASSASTPAPPASLTEAALALRARMLDEFENWCVAEVALLDLALQAHDRAEACRTAIARDGLVLRSSRGGQPHPHPLLRVLRTEERFFADAMAQLRVGHP